MTLENLDLNYRDLDGGEEVCVPRPSGSKECHWVLKDLVIKNGQFSKRMVSVPTYTQDESRSIHTFQSCAHVVAIALYYPDGYSTICAVLPCYVTVYALQFHPCSDRYHSTSNQTAASVQRYSSLYSSGTIIADTRTAVPLHCLYCLWHFLCQDFRVY